MAGENDIYTPGATGGSINWAALAQQEKKNKKPEQKGNFLTSLLPTGGGIGGALAGGAGGAAIGSVVPGVGTAIGGLLGAILGGASGSALGKVGQNAAEGESDLGKGVAQEALFGGLTSTPITGGLKVLKGGAQLAKAAVANTGKEAAKKSFQEAGQLAIPKAAKSLQLGAGQEIEQTRALLPRLSGTAAKVNPLDQARAESLGIRVGEKTRSGDITPDVATRLTDFANTGSQKYGGVRAGKPINQAADAQAVHNNVIKALDSELGKIDRTITSDEVSGIVSNATRAVADNAAVLGSAKTLGKFTEKLVNAKSVKDLEKIRKEADDLAYSATGAKKTSAAAQANAVREAVDGFVTELSPAYKAIKGDYSLSKQLLETASKASKNSKGLELPLRGPLGTIAAGGNTAVGAKNAITGLLSKVRGKKEPVISPDLADAFGPKTTGQGILGAVARESFLGSRPSITGEQPVEAETAPPADQLGADGLNSSTLEDTNPFSKDRVQNLILQDLQGNGGKNIANLMKLYETFGADTSKSEPKLTSSQATRAAAAQNALNDIPLLENSIKSGKLGAAKAIPGAGTALGRRILGTEDLDAALFNIADNILRARSGAAAPEAEVRRFVDTFLPGALDSEKAKQQKLDRAVRELYGYVNPTAASQGADVQALVESSL